MNVRYLILLATLTFLGSAGSVTAHPCLPGETPETHKHCRGEGPDPEPDDTAVYTATLVEGDFVFVVGTGQTLEDLTANRKGTGLPGNQLLKMDPMVTASQLEWDNIFSACLSLVTGGHITGFDVLDDNWTIDYTKDREGPGNIHLTMRNLVIYPSTSNAYNRVDFDFDLHGAVDPNVPFLPQAVDAKSEHYLTHYKLWAGAGGKDGFTCNSDGWPELTHASKLVIERVE